MNRTTLTQGACLNRAISIVINAYNAQEALDRQLADWAAYEPALRERVEFIVVDDASAVPLQVSAASLPGELRLSLARIHQDIAWNMPGARNLGALLASGRFLLFHDIDHFLPPLALKRLIDNADALHTNTLYSFQRFLDGQQIHLAVNCFLCSRDGFWQVGGYDEDFAGHYGHEDRFFLDAWVGRIGPRVLLTNVWLEVVKRYGTQGLSRDTARNAALFQQKLDAGLLGHTPRSRLRFPWSVQLVTGLPPATAREPARQPEAQLAEQH
jgi:glycosyltransferase involved in cell wall biosynthesis